MGKCDRIGGLIWLLLGTFISILAFRYKVGNLNNPGAGFIPFYLGILLGISGLILHITTYSFDLKTSNNNHQDTLISETEIRKKLKVPLLSVLITFAYIVLLNSAGFLLTSFIFLFVLFKLSHPAKWFLPLLLSVSTVILTYVVFSVWLQSQFPRGILSF